jgi:ketosteroid isomerase-like protein
MTSAISTQQRNAATVAGIYESFGRGDIPAILDQLADDVEWLYAVPDHGMPWYRPRSGHAGVVEFFRTLSEGMPVHRFEPQRIIGQGDTVASLISLGASLAGREINVHAAHFWTFNSDGKAVRLQLLIDQTEMVEAYRSAHA